MMERHTFAICAYKESPFLEECICSLKNQTQQSLIIMITSTPNEHIKNLVERYNIPLYVYTTFCLFIHHLSNTGLFPLFGYYE